MEFYLLTFLSYKWNWVGEEMSVAIHRFAASKLSAKIKYLLCREASFTAANYLSQSLSWTRVGRHSDRKHHCDRCRWFNTCTKQMLPNAFLSWVCIYIETYVLLFLCLLNDIWHLLSLGLVSLQIIASAINISN